MISKSKKKRKSLINAEIEEALRIQRESSMAEASSETFETPNDTELPGYYFDKESNRFFKITKDSKFKYNQKKSDVSTPIIPSIIDAVNSQNLRMRPRCVMSSNPLIIATALTLARQPDSYRVTSGLPLHDATYNPHFGVAFALPSQQIIISSTAGSERKRYTYCIEVPNMSIQGIRWLETWPSDTQSTYLAAYGTQVTSSKYILSVVKPHLSPSRDRFRGIENWKLESVPNTVIWSEAAIGFCVGTSTGIAIVGFESSHVRTYRKFPSPVVQLCNLFHRINNSCISFNSHIAGLRNGNIINVDLRTPENTNNLAKLPSCIDCIDLLTDGVSLLALDVTGKMALFDVRMPRTEVFEITPATKLVRNRRFFIPSNTNFDQVVALIHPSIVSEGIGIYSLTSPQSLLRVCPYPKSITCASEENFSVLLSSTSHKRSQITADRGKQNYIWEGLYGIARSASTTELIVSE